MRKLIALLTLLIAIATFYACSELPRNASHAGVPDESIEKGKVLAAQYCGSCHLLPDPALLNAASWEKGVLPNMGPRLGIFAYGFERYPASRNPHLPRGFYPDTPVLSFVAWQHIIDYYTATAPDSLIIPKNPISKNLQQFSVQAPHYKTAVPLASFTGIDTLRRQVVVFDMGSRQLLRFDRHLKIADSLQVTGAISDVQMDKAGYAWANMGDIYPGDAALGSAQQWNGSMTDTPLFLFKNLQRPVALQRADINKDGRMDFVVGSFGFLTGHLSWYEAQSNGTFKQHLIKPLPGAAQLYITDENRDGLPDLWVLFAQGDESIRKYINQGNGSFKEEVIMRFPPVWGSTSFELTDMDNDGDKDIVYTCGDNADYSQVLKPYHGVYVFLQEQAGVFRQRYFFHLNGAFKARTLDFDKDGDQDIAAISFFADYQHKPEEGFVYLENKGAWNFDATTFSQAASGRWITLDAGDLDGDGWPDLVLGNMAKQGAVVPTRIDWKKAPLFVVLRNKGRN